MDFIGDIGLEHGKFENADLCSTLLSKTPYKKMSKNQDNKGQLLSPDFYWS